MAAPWEEIHPLSLNIERTKQGKIVMRGPRAQMLIHASRDIFPRVVYMEEVEGPDVQVNCNKLA
eukprot:315401-Pyramimonas_sp.AAC.1